VVTGVSTQVGKLNPREKKLLSALSRYVKLYLYCLHDAVSDVIDYLWEREHARVGVIGCDSWYFLCRSVEFHDRIDRM